MNLILLEKIEEFVEQIRKEGIELSLFGETDLNELENLTCEIRSYFDKENYQADFEEYESIA